jgi:hypothetical protein
MSRCFDPEIYLLCRFYWIKQRKKFYLETYPIVNDYYYVHTVYMSSRSPKTWVVRQRSIQIVFVPTHWYTHHPKSYQTDQIPSKKMLHIKRNNVTHFYKECKELLEIRYLILYVTLVHVSLSSLFSLFSPFAN